ncbi:ABC transporter substrate-binding protein [Bradyrhizobium sp. 191]|uniref:ABC transporter substrate-binding protein n=1 Tax=Bradyrhizobium sp. 191 TaxID=2782659 RepID=UPI001FFF6D70|nr:ABC transporter substrate-binding protein [Bradyrhizobium sp. 191]UPJ63796.1 ABC transporter substrate-binding protein [Bradyrhizobium sp. 191]
MTTFKYLAALAGVLLLGSTSVHTEPVKVGIIGPFSGPFSNFGEGWKAAIDAYQKLHGKSAGGQEIELIFRDLTGPNPSEAKALVQELVIKEKVQYLGGIVFTPNAFAIAPVVEEARIPTVIFNAATSSVLDKSKYFVRTSYTLPQITVPIARFMLDEHINRAVTMVSDYAPGADAEGSFIKTFEAGGGKVIEKVRVPLKTTDFGPFLQRVKGSAPQALFIFFPGGPPSYGVIKAYKDNDLRSSGIRFFGTSEADEKDLPAIGDSALGLESGMFYSGAHASAANEEFVTALKAVAPTATANATALEGFDGMAAIYHMVDATKGQRNPDAAMAAIRRFAWESPRGPVRIDPESRHIVQNVYIRKVEKGADGKLFHKEFKTYEQQPDYGRADTK